MVPLSPTRTVTAGTQVPAVSPAHGARQPPRQPGVAAACGESERDPEHESSQPHPAGREGALTGAAGEPLAGAAGAAEELLDGAAGAAMDGAAGGELLAGAETAELFAEAVRAAEELLAGAAGEEALATEGRRHSGVRCVESLRAPGDAQGARGGCQLASSALPLELLRAFPLLNKLYSMLGGFAGANG